MRDNRAAVQIVDVIMMLSVIVTIVVTAPFYYEFTSMVAAEADPFTSLLLQLVLPGIILGAILSIGVSARRAT